MTQKQINKLLISLEKIGNILKDMDDILERMGNILKIA
jgi:hypothetical protein